MLIKWLSGNVSFFFEEIPRRPLRLVLMCVVVSRLRGRKVATNWLLTFFFLLSFSRPRGVTAEMQSRQQWPTLSAWKETGEVGGWRMKKGGVLEGVYLSHGNWFAGVEVGSFKKTSFSLTPSHLSVWKAAGRKSGSTERGRQWRSAAAEAFSYKGPRKWVSVSEGSIWCQPEINGTFFLLHSAK